MSNEERRDRRNYLRSVLRASQRQRQEIEAQRERDPHSVDSHALRDIGRNDVMHMRELKGIGGSDDLNETT